VNTIKRQAGKLKEPTPGGQAAGMILELAVFFQEKFPDRNFATEILFSLLNEKDLDAEKYLELIKNSGKHFFSESLCIDRLRYVSALCLQAMTEPKHEKATNSAHWQMIASANFILGFELSTHEAQFVEEMTSRFMSSRARRAAESRHASSGGSRHKQQLIRELWASGKFSSRDVCAEQECAALGMSFSAARKALRRTPDPS